MSYLVFQFLLCSNSIVNCNFWGLAGWSPAPPTEGFMLLPTHDRDLTPGSGKGFDNQANMCCHAFVVFVFVVLYTTSISIYL
jgi:hypothetical protein